MQYLKRFGGYFAAIIAVALLLAIGQRYIGLILLVTLVMMVILPSFVVVPEHKVFVVENILRKQFHKVLQPGRYLLPPYLRVREEIDTLFFGTEVRVEGLKSADSFPHTIEVSASGQPNITIANQEMLASLVKVLNKETLANIFRSKVAAAAREVLGQYDAETLGRGQLLARFNQLVKVRLTEKLAFFGVQVFAVEIGQIIPDANLQQARVAAKSRELESTVMIDALTQLRDLLVSLSEQDKALLLNMEQTRLMARSGATIIHNNHATVPNTNPMPYYVIPNEIVQEQRNINA